MHKRETSGSGRIWTGDAARALVQVPARSVDLTLFSPPYQVGKDYEHEIGLDTWEQMLHEVLAQVMRVLRPGAFCVVNIADLKRFEDPAMPADKGVDLNNRRADPDRARMVMLLGQGATMAEVGRTLGVSTSTIARRMGRGASRKTYAATRVEMLDRRVLKLAEDAGLLLYDRRIWVKDPCWNNNPWHANTYRSIDEFEHLLVLWKAGPLMYDRTRLEPEEWVQWGSRAVWRIPTASTHRGCEGRFPSELAVRIIRMLSIPGERVLDPFAGVGTTLACASRLGRDWIGVERDPRRAAIARRYVRG